MNAKGKVDKKTGKNTCGYIIFLTQEQFYSKY